MRQAVGTSAYLVAIRAELNETLCSALDVQGGMPAGFNLDHRLKEWLGRPQPALGGARPVELLDTPDRIESVRRVLGVVISGACQYEWVP